MHVAVCIVSFRNPGDVVGCLAALTKSTHADFEVFICENGGESAFEAIRQQVSLELTSGQVVTVLQAPSNLGYAGGVNLCMKAATDADAWWILNPDTVPEPAALANLCARLSRGDCGAVGCTLRSAAGVVESRGGHWNPWLARAVSMDHGERSSSVPPEFPESALSYLSGASMLVGRSLVDAVGLMREDYFLYGEEVEWCLRAISRGLKLGLAVDAEVLHRQGTTTGSVHDIALRGRLPVFLDERNKLLITRDRFPQLLPFAALGALTMLALRFGRRGAWTQLAFAVQGWWSGLANQRGRPDWVAEH